MDDADRLAEHLGLADREEAGDDGEYLRDQILRRVSESLVASIRPKEPYGIEYEVRMMIDGLNGVTIPIITGWLLPPERRLV